ncbi:ribokinase [Dyadobacter sandarakinus]|nr:ribokinase [Dyadobacter sandarakinus]
MIYVVGSSNTDMVVRSEKLPAPGETVIGESFLMNPGGKGANQAVGASRLGGQVTFIGKIGDDLFGRGTLDHFRQEGLVTDFVVTDPELPSGIALINVNAAGENCIAVAPGANNALMGQEVLAGLEKLTAGDIVLVQLEIQPEAVEAAVNRAREKGAKVILNPAPARHLPDNLLHDLFLITPNETEAALLTGMPVSGEEDVRRAAQMLLQKGVRNVVITLGSRGALIRTNAYERMIAAPEVTAVDTTAAGDCFNGALAVGLSERMNLEDAVRFACAAAAVSVTRPGAQSAMPYRKEVVRE